ncbi:MAG: T9SS type A sorting domain-containing protein [Ginsengibacter sp.]
MRKNFHGLIFLLATSVYANAQSIGNDKRWKRNFPQNIYQIQNFKLQNLNTTFKTNPYWKQVNVPHKDSSFIQDVEVPNARTVWGTIGFYNIERPATIYYVRTSDEGYSWKLDSLPISTDYGINSFAPLDAYTCYAAVANVFIGGGGIYKTNNGGKTWHQLSPGQLFGSTSYPDFVHFWDESHGVAVGDGNGPGTPYFEIYTTSNAGATWERIPAGNIPIPDGFPYSFNNGYTVAGNRIWFQGFDSNGGHFIYRSDDYGHHWKSFPITVKHFGDFAFTDRLNGLANGFDNKGITEIYSSHDGGETWKKVNYSVTPMALYITAVPGTTTYVTTSSFATIAFGSSYSTDNGKTWTLIDSGANALHNDVKFLNSCIGWSGETETSASDHGGMFKWKGFLPNDNDKNISDASIAKITLSNEINIKLYPNPAINILKVEGLHSSVNNKLSIIDASGRMAWQLNTSNTNYTFDIQRLAAGNYYLKIETDKNVTTLKFVKK